MLTTKRFKIVCRICRTALDKITNEHLSRHGINAEGYRRMFPGERVYRKRERNLSAGEKDVRSADGAQQQLDAAISVALTRQPAQIMERLTHALLTRDDITRLVADEVGEALFTSSVRDRLRVSLVSVLTARMAALGQATAHFEALKQELNAPWRRLQGGEAGGPTPTKDLVAAGHLMLAEIKSAEESMYRAVKMAIDEERSRRQIAGLESTLTEGLRFTGAAEKLPLAPSDLTPTERESIRSIFSSLKGLVESRHDRPGTPNSTPPRPPVTLEVSALPSAPAPSSGVEAAAIPPSPTASGGAIPCSGADRVRDPDDAF